MNKSGYSLVEMLVVLAVLGILMGIVFGGREAMQRAQLQEAVSVVTQQLERARSTSSRTSRTQAVTWTETTLSAGDHTAALPHGATITTAQPAGGLEYTAPYGELLGADGSNLGGGFTLTVRGPSGRERNVYLVGVTGKVHTD